VLHDFTQFVMLRQAGTADNREDSFDIRVEQTFTKDAATDHARRSEKNHFHLIASRFSRMRIPIRMRRPSAAREALGLSPLV
jgi:hypothetical protein